jgi:hypothetical protein
MDAQEPLIVPTPDKCGICGGAFPSDMAYGATGVKEMACSTKCLEEAIRRGDSRAGAGR